MFCAAFTTDSAPEAGGPGDGCCHRARHGKVESSPANDLDCIHDSTHKCRRSTWGRRIPRWRPQSSAQWRAAPGRAAARVACCRRVSSPQSLKALQRPCNRRRLRCKILLVLDSPSQAAVYWRAAVSCRMSCHRRGRGSCDAHAADAQRGVRTCFQSAIHIKWLSRAAESACKILGQGNSKCGCCLAGPTTH